jgi:hypothetical protein
VGGLLGVVNDLKSEFASQTTVAKAISIVSHIASDAFVWEQGLKSTGHPSNGQNGNSQPGGGRQSPKAGGSVPLVTHATAAHSNENGHNPARVTKSRPPVPTKVLEALPGFFNGLESELKNEKERLSLYSEVRSIGNHVMSEVRD